jgi:CO dehydrogenase maturation factor
MTKTLAFSGKGGTGKTTIAGLVIRYLIENHLAPILAVDADANSNLNEVLGVEVTKKIGTVREEAIEEIKRLPPGMLKEKYFEMRIQDAIVESRGFDLIVMGRPEGPGCYCYANIIFRKYVDAIGDSYRFVVMDNEAGMEHLSRRTTKDVDLLFIVSDPTFRGLATAERIKELVGELGLRCGRIHLVVNRVQGELPKDFLEEIKTRGFTEAEFVPEDRMVSELDLRGQPIFDLPLDSSSMKAVEEMMSKVLSETLKQEAFVRQNGDRLRGHKTPVF